MSSFTLMNGQSIWVERVTWGSGWWSDGVYHTGEEVITYEVLTDNFVEPMDGEEVQASAAGYSTSDVRLLLTDHVLNTYRENQDNAAHADKIHLRDPESGKKSTPWVVWDTESWDADDGFTMLTSGNNYILVREDRLK